MKIVIIGGTGLIGSKTVTRLAAKGHEVIAASPNTGVNTITGEGLAEALKGAQVVIDLANSPSFEDKAVLDFFETSGRNLIAAEKAAGVGHHIALSVVGTRSASWPLICSASHMRPPRTWSSSTMRMRIETPIFGAGAVTVLPSVPIPQHEGAVLARDLRVIARHVAANQLQVVAAAAPDREHRFVDVDHPAPEGVGDFETTVSHRWEKGS